MYVLFWGMTSPSAATATISAAGVGSRRKAASAPSVPASTRGEAPGARPLCGPPPPAPRPGPDPPLAAGRPAERTDPPEELLAGDARPNLEKLRQAGREGG